MKDKIETILLDIEVQNDFFSPGGSLYTPKASEVARKIHRLFAWARRERLPVISTLLRVRPQDHGPAGLIPHCVDGTPGELRLRGTVLPSRINLGLRNITDLPRHVFRTYQQVIVEKRQTDIFLHARLERLITEMPLTTFVICGAGISHGIVQATVGLRSRGFGVVIANDAIYEMDGEKVDMAYRRMDAKGAVFAPTSEIVLPQPKKLVVAFRTGQPVMAEPEREKARTQAR